jgi:hypothetical protein
VWALTGWSARFHFTQVERGEKVGAPRPDVWGVPVCDGSGIGWNDFDVFEFDPCDLDTVNECFNFNELGHDDLRKEK